MRSQYNNTQKFEKESRLYFENICFQCGWKFRSYGQENDIDGEIEIFDKVNKNGKEIDETKQENIFYKNVHKYAPLFSVIKSQGGHSLALYFLFYIQV